jgi:hypothetical protein
VGFARSQKVISLVDGLSSSGRKIFLFVDGEHPKHKLECKNMRTAAIELQNKYGIQVHQSGVNLGVGRAIPAGIEWAFNYTQSLIVIEDDCSPNEFALSYFDESLPYLKNEFVMVCGISPGKKDEESHNYGSSTSSFPLIWGWATTKDAWNKIAFQEKRSTLTRAAIEVLSSPRKVIRYNFFYAARIRIERGNLNAWDSVVAHQMLRKNLYSIVPDISLFSNTGADSVGSHKFELDNISGDSVLTATRAPITLPINFGHEARRETDKKIIKNIYRMRPKHLFSPLKAYLEN